VNNFLDADRLQNLVDCSLPCVVATPETGDHGDNDAAEVSEAKTPRSQQSPQSRRPSKFGVFFARRCLHYNVLTVA